MSTATGGRLDLCFGLLGGRDGDAYDHHPADHYHDPTHHDDDAAHDDHHAGDHHDDHDAGDHHDDQGHNHHHELVSDHSHRSPRALLSLARYQHATRIGTAHDLGTDD